MNFRQNDIIFLLGAGASVDAGIPTSIQMIKDVEALLEKNEEWNLYKKLYNFVKSSILHGDGINGLFGNNVTYNIERLVYTLSELEQNEQHILYPFTTGWHPKLVELAEPNFERISQLKRKIVGRLKEKWILLENYEKANYYRALMEFQKVYQYPIRIFSLNYDLCVEKTCQVVRIERGFNEERLLDVKLFEDDPDEPVNFFLYKMHGSIDWKKNEYGLLTYSDEAGSISIRELEIIFGTNNKLQYADPYLFSFYEFARYCLRAKLIITIGYSFGDEHINGIMGQALRQNGKTKILSVRPSGNEAQKKQEIAQKLALSNIEQVKVVLEAAKNFMEMTLRLEYLKNFFPGQDSIFDK